MNIPSQTYLPSNMNQQTTQLLTQPTYVSKTKVQPLTIFNHPTVHKGIFSYISESKIRDYLLAVSQITGNSKDVIAMLRISNNRVAIFLVYPSMIDSFISKNSVFKILNHYIFVDACRINRGN